MSGNYGAECADRRRNAGTPWAHLRCSPLVRAGYCSVLLMRCATGCPTPPSAARSSPHASRIPDGHSRSETPRHPAPFSPSSPRFAFANPSFSARESFLPPPSPASALSPLFPFFMYSLLLLRSRGGGGVEPAGSPSRTRLSPHGGLGPGSPFGPGPELRSAATLNGACALNP